jgi:dihydroorotate dehydrogenase
MGASFPIIGVGGIVNVDTALATLRAGATLIQVYTGFAYRGHVLLQEILHALARKQCGGTVPAMKALGC